MSTKTFANFVFVFGKHILAGDLTEAAITKKDGSTLVNTKRLFVTKAEQRKCRRSTVLRN